MHVSLRFFCVNIIFTGFTMWSVVEKHAFLQGVFSPSAGWLWASTQAGASHPFHVTLGSGLESVSWCGTKCLACESTERGYGANCPSQVHRSSVGLQCTWDYMNDQFGVGWGCAAMCHPRVHMCGGKGNVCVCVLCLYLEGYECASLDWCPQNMSMLLFFFFLSSLRCEVQLPVQLRVAGR